MPSIKSPVYRYVLSVGQNRKVFRPVVVLDLVEVVDMFVGAEVSAQDFFHHQPVFQNSVSHSVGMAGRVSEDIPGSGACKATALPRGIGGACLLLWADRGCVVSSSLPLFRGKVIGTTFRRRSNSSPMFAQLLPALRGQISRAFGLGRGLLTWSRAELPPGDSRRWPLRDFPALQASEAVSRHASIFPHLELVRKGWCS